MVSIEETPNMILTLVLIALVAGVGAFLLGSLREGIEPLDATSVSNETLTSVNTATNVTLARSSIGNLSSISVYNNTVGNELIGANNYIIQETLGLAGEDLTSFNFILTADGWNNTDVNISYTITDWNTKGTILNNGTIAVGNLSEQMPTVGTIFGIGLIISIIAIVFLTIGRRREY